MANAKYKIYCITDKKVFNNVTEAAGFYKVKPFKIYAVINGHQRTLKAEANKVLEFKKLDEKEAKMLLHQQKKEAEEAKEAEEKLKNKNIAPAFKKLIEDKRNKYIHREKWDLDEISKPQKIKQTDVCFKDSTKKSVLGTILLTKEDVNDLMISFDKITKIFEKVLMNA